MELYLHSPYVLMAWYLVKQRDNFTVTLQSLKVHHGHDKSPISSSISYTVIRYVSSALDTYRTRGFLTMFRKASH
jgi:hypothetical protein